MRLFFAILLQPQAAQAVSQLQKSLASRCPKGAIRWVAQEQLHYTLKFLGDVPEQQLAACSEAARQSMVGLRAFTIELAGIGAFPTSRAPRVIWVGACKGAEELSTAAARLEQALGPLGFSREVQAFVPHLTIARIKGPEAERAAASLFSSEHVGQLACSPVDSMVLMQSTLSPNGATYSVLERYGLEPSPS